MLREDIVLLMYQDNDSIRRSESIEEFKKRILHGLELSKNPDMNSSLIQDYERSNLNLALKYNLELMAALL